MEIPVHSSVLAARSNVLAEMILPLRDLNEKKNSRSDIAEDKIADKLELQENIIDKENKHSNVRVRSYSVPLLQNVWINLF